MILVIAEKPSVAQSIAKVLGATSRKDGYMEGGNYIVSWCFGHLVELADASSYDERYAKWRYDDLPIVPESWMFEVTKDKAQQFKVLSALMKDKRVTELVCATDAGREGELIFRLVYDKAGCTKPFKRLWISSLEDSAIREGFNHLRDSKEYDRLYEAALSRSKADWIVGINGTRLFTTLYHKKLVVGRVQTPTLAMLVERDGKISTFQKEKYFNVHVGKGDLTADLEKVKTEEEAKRIAAACEKKQAVVSSLKRETKTVNPPKLYDLTTLQREANRYYGFTAQQTLDLVQTLYEKKLLTYPRTDSQFITDDMEDTARQVISIVCRQLPLFSGVSVTPDIARVTDNSKVTDHHAILPTVQLEKQDVSVLPQSEQKILNLVGMRLLCATGEKHTYAETQITLSCEGYAFKTKGKTIVQNGWKAVEELFKASLKTKEKDDPVKSLPEVHEGDMLDGVSASVTEHFTTPPKQYTEDTLLSAMETAGNDQFDDDTEKKGLGTPATRAGIIEKLVKSGFAERKGKSLIPTKDGCNLVCVLPEQITSPAMTAEWENTLMEIERGNADADAFLSGIVQMTGDLVKAYPFLSDAEAQRFGTGKEEIGKCPRCGSPVYVGKGNFYCSNKDCSFCLWEDNKFFSSKKKKLTKKIAKELLDKGWCRVTGLYTPKKPQLYDAVIRLDDSGGKYVSFKMEFDKLLLPARTAFGFGVFLVVHALVLRRRDHRQPVFLAYLITELTQFPIGSLVAPVGVEVHIIHGIEDDVIMAMSLVDVCSNHILVLALEPFVRKLLSDFMSLFRCHFTDVKRLDQMTGKHLRHLHSLLYCKVSRPLKFFCCRVACSASIGRNIEGIVRLLRVENIGKSLVYSSSDWLDFSNCHISPCLSFSSAISSA